MQTLSEYATYDRLLLLIIKERVKHCRRHTSERKPTTDSLYEFLPPRKTWIRPKNRKRFLQRDGRIDLKKQNARAIYLTIKRDQSLQLMGNGHYPYLNRLDDLIFGLQDEIRSVDIHFAQPTLRPIKKEEKIIDGVPTTIYRPLSIYRELHDKILLGITCRYLMAKFNWFLHDNILSYRAPRSFGEKKRHVTDFNDGILLIEAFRRAHLTDSIYVSDCDIRKFYDTIPHRVVRQTMLEMLQASSLSELGCNEVMAVLDAYLQSYNFRDNVLAHPLRNGLFDYVPGMDASGRGVPQGGALSLIIADVVLNHVDRSVLRPEEDPNRLLVRLCDDMVLMHTDEESCRKLMTTYTDALERCGLSYHPFTDVASLKDSSAPRHTTAAFWHAKSHLPFLWAEGEGNCSAYIGFLGYEMHRNGEVRLRRSNIDKYTKKIHHAYFSMRRAIERAQAAGKELSDAQREELVANHISRLERALNFYTALDELPMSHRQLHMLAHRRSKLIRQVLKITKNPRLASVE